MKKRIGLILTLLVSMFILSSCSDYYEGEEIEIREFCIGCYDRVTFNLYVENINDEEVVADFLENHYATHLMKGERGRVLVNNKVTMVVEMNHHPGKRIWVFKKYIKKAR